jgi:hypothetical protein
VTKVAYIGEDRQMAVVGVGVRPPSSRLVVFTVHLPYVVIMTNSW